MALRRTVDAGSEPVALSDLKDHLRVTDTTDDALLTALIVSCRNFAENTLGRALITQTWVKTLDAFPNAIELPYPPTQAITSVVYLDDAGVSTLLAAAAYELDDKTEPGWLVPAYDYQWPTTRQSINAVTVTYTAGYGDIGNVPQAIKTWIMLQCGHLYENREATLIGAPIVSLPFIDSLLDPYRVRRM